MNAATATATRSTVEAVPTLKMVRARREDMPTIAGFVSSSADWYREIVDEKDMAEHDVDETWQEENYRRREFYLGVAGDEAVGTLSIQDFGDHLYLGYVYLDVAHVGKGYGGKLLNYARRQAEMRRKAGLALICHPEATWAVKAYEKFGFERIHTAKQHILSWKDGALEPHYEEGFHLYTFPVARGRR